MKYLTLKLQNSPLPTKLGSFECQYILFKLSKSSSYLWRRTRGTTSTRLQHHLRLSLKSRLRTHILQTDSFKIHYSCSYLVRNSHGSQLFLRIVYFNTLLAKHPWMYLLVFSLSTILRLMLSRYVHYFEILQYLAIRPTGSLKQVLTTFSSCSTRQTPFCYVQPFRRL